MAKQTIKTYKGNEVRCRVHIASDGSGDAPADWEAGTVGGITVVGIATSAEVKGKTDVTDINGLNQQEPYNTKAGNITYDWKLDQLFITANWVDDSGTEIHPANMIKSGKKFAFQISGMNDVGENATASEFDITCTQCSVGDDSIAVDGSDGDVTLNMSGKCASRNTVVV